jgi:hypothetical protein
MRAVIAASLILATTVAWAAESPDATPEQRREAVSNGHMLPPDQRQPFSRHGVPIDRDPLVRALNQFEADQAKLRARCEADKKHTTACYDFWRQLALGSQQAIQSKQRELDEQIAITSRLVKQLRHDEALERDLVRENDDIRQQAVAEIDKAYDSAQRFIDAAAGVAGAAPTVITVPLPTFAAQPGPTIPAPELSLAPPQQPRAPVFRSAPIRAAAPPLPTMTHCTASAVGNTVTSVEMNCVTAP